MTPSVRDGGYGWVTVFAFFLTEVLVDGIRFSFGILFVELLNEFSSGKGETAWIGSIMVGMYNLCGPVFALIISKLGCRKACFVGSGVTCVGLICSSFTTELWHMYITYGIFLGFGYGLLFLAGTVTIGQYFLKRRAMALGLAYCGSGVGQFGFTPLLNLIVQTYTWRGAMFICAGLSLQCCVFGALYRPFRNNVIEEFDIHLSTNDVNDDSVKYTEEVTPMLSIKEYEHNEMDNIKINVKLNGNETNVYPKSRPQNGAVNKSKHVDPGRTFAQMREEQLSSFMNRSRSNFGSSRSLNLSVLSQTILGSNASFEHIIARRKRLKADKVLRNETSKKDVDCLDKEKKTNVYNISLIESVFPKRLMTDINFFWMMIASFLYGIPAFVPYAILPDYAIYNGVAQSDSVWLISAMGIGGIISHVVLGIVADIPCVHRLSLFATNLMICGVSTLLVPFLKTFPLLLTYSFVFGFSYGAIYVVQPCLLLEYFGEEFIAEIFGVLMFVLGIAVLIGSPAAGWLFDLTKDYNVSVIFAGSIFFLSGLTSFLVLCSKPSREKKKRNENANGKPTGLV